MQSRSAGNKREKMRILLTDLSNGKKLCCSQLNQNCHERASYGLIEMQTISSGIVTNDAKHVPSSAKEKARKCCVINERGRHYHFPFVEADDDKSERGILSFRR